MWRFSTRSRCPSRWIHKNPFGNVGCCRFDSFNFQIRSKVIPKTIKIYVKIDVFNLLAFYCCCYFLYQRIVSSVVVRFSPCTSPTGMIYLFCLPQHPVCSPGDRRLISFLGTNLVSFKSDKRNKVLSVCITTQKLPLSGENNVTPG